MQIRIKLMGNLKDRSPEGGVLDLPAGATVDDAIEAMELAVDKAHVVTVNGQMERDRSRKLEENDELTILPPVGGG